MFDASSLNERQLQAASYVKGNLLVLAGPGSGKTFTTIQRIFFITEKLKVAPENILVITFTKDAALSMQNRFISMESFPQPVCFGTFHSVFYHILQNYFPDKKLNILSSSEKKKIINGIVIKFINDKKESGEITDCFIRTMSFYKNTGDIKKALKISCRFNEEFFNKILKEYEYYRVKHCLVDYDDMVMDCRNVLATDEIFRKKWQKRFSFILIDEFQDINQIQYETVGLLTGKDTTLFAVGDDDQSIYGFRGADNLSLRKFISDYSANVINLNLNYRNPENIIHASEMVIKENSDRITKESRAVNASCNDNLTVKGFTDNEEEYGYICDILQKMKNETSVCLFRTNLGMQNFAIFLNRKGIHFSIKEKIQSVYEHFAVRDILAYFNFSNDTNDLESALLIANKPVREIDRESLIDGKNLQQKLKISERELSFIKKSGMFLSLEFILNKIGYKRYLQEKFWDNREKLEECMEIIEWLKKDMKDYESLSEYKLHMKSYEGELRKRQEDDNCKVILMTMHGSKGLEFENVFIPDCNEGNYPHGKIPDIDTVCEERRLFYVGMTRASERLYLLYIKGTKERIMMPSRFLNKLI